LGIDQGVGEAEIVLSTVFVVADEVLAEAGFSLTEERGGNRRIGDQRVHEVWQSAHQAEGGFGAELFGAHAPCDVFGSLGHKK
jgi:hypothetical protein